MSKQRAQEVTVTFAEGVRDDVASLTEATDETADTAEVDALKLAIAPRAGLRAHRKARQRAQPAGEPEKRQSRK